MLEVPVVEPDTSHGDDQCIRLNQLGDRRCAETEWRPALLRAGSSKQQTKQQGIQENHCTDFLAVSSAVGIEIRQPHMLQRPTRPAAASGTASVVPHSQVSSMLMGVASARGTELLQFTFDHNREALHMRKRR